jgi:hypothetical protein
MLSFTRHEVPNAPCVLGQTAEAAACAPVVCRHAVCHNKITKTKHSESIFPTHLQLFGFTEVQAKLWMKEGLPEHIGSPNTRSHTERRIAGKNNKGKNLMKYY